MALLVDRRGAPCSAESAAAILWGSESLGGWARRRRFSLCLQELSQALEAAGAADILSASRSGPAVQPENFDCDYYAALAGDMTAMNAFSGEYMAPYPWAKYTEAGLAEKFRQG